jgi:hypothetical protein
MPPVNTPAPNPTTVTSMNVSPPVQLFPAPSQPLVDNTNSLLNDVEKDWRSPAFWLQVAVQLLSWYAYLSATDPSLKIGTLTVSLGSLVAYLTHSAVIKKQ